MDTYPGSTEEAHPELFGLQAMPEQPKEKKPGQLSKDDVEQFFREVRTQRLCPLNIFFNLILVNLKSKVFELWYPTQVEWEGVAI